MPIVPGRIEARIYSSTWVGTVTKEEILGGVVERMAVEQGEIPYVTIIDASQLKKFPFNARVLSQGRKVYVHALAILIVKPPMMGRVIADMVGRITPLRFEYFETLEAAVAHARHLLKEDDARE